MSNIKNLSFITPLITDCRTGRLVLDKEYSKTLHLGIRETIYISSNIGNRSNQEDSLAVEKNGNNLLLLVADGMGGHENGEIASYYTAKTIQEWFKIENPLRLATMDENHLRKTINELLYIVTEKIPKNSGTTLTMAIITGSKTFIINIGDSRTYTIGKKGLELETEDDSYAFERFLHDTSEERDNLRFFKGNNLVTDAIMQGKMPSVSIKIIPNRKYDILCQFSDGVTDILTEKIIEATCQLRSPAKAITDDASYGPSIKSEILDISFVKKMSRGKDNATAIIYRKK